MAWSINKAFVLGNITRDPEMRYTGNGQGVTSFGVATNRRWKDQSGAIQEDTQFHEVVAWGKLAETITQILKKGAKVAVIGRLQTRTWDAPDGSKRSRTEIIMEDFVPLTQRNESLAGGGSGDDIAFLDSQAAVSEGTGAPATNKKTTKSTKSETPSAPLSSPDEINLDDIPF